MVAMLSFSDGKWDQKYREQQIKYWKRVDVPKPPRLTSVEDRD